MKATADMVQQAFFRTATFTSPSSMYLINMMLNAFECERVLEQGLFLGGVPLMLNALNPERRLQFVTTENLDFSKGEGDREHYQKILANKGIPEHQVPLEQFVDLPTLHAWVQTESIRQFGIPLDLTLVGTLDETPAGPYDFIHMDCTDDYDAAVIRMQFMIERLSDDGIFCVDDFNSSEGFMRALAVGKFVRSGQLWPLACDLRKVYFSKRRNAIDRLTAYMQPEDYEAYPNLLIHVRQTKVHQKDNRFMIMVAKR